MIDPHQKEQLLTDGYVLLPAAVPRPLLERLQAMAARLEADRLADYAAGRRNPHTAIFETADGPVLERLDKLLEADRECALDLLATPAMMAVAREFCGQGAVPLEMDVLFKRQHPNGYVIWHQGAQHSRRCPLDLLARERDFRLVPHHVGRGVVKRFVAGVGQAARGRQTRVMILKRERVLPILKYTILFTTRKYRISRQDIKTFG